jgi:hypothetical protein
MQKCVKIKQFSELALRLLSARIGDPHLKISRQLRLAPPAVAICGLQHGELSPLETLELQLHSGESTGAKKPAGQRRARRLRSRLGWLFAQTNLGLN